MFHNPGQKPVVSHKEVLKDLSRMISSQSLLTEGKRTDVLADMKAMSALDNERYSSLCETLMHTLANYVQHVPETTNSFYAQAGGLLDHALYRTESALHLFKQFTVLNRGEVLSEEQKLWQYALHTAALLQGIGKLYVDYRINVYDGAGISLTAWNPLLNSLTTNGSFYDYHFLKDTDMDFRKRVNVLLAHIMMPPNGFAWIASNEKVLTVWLALLQEDYRSAGTLGAILIRADALAIQRYFNEFLLRNAAVRTGRQRQLGPFHNDTPDTLAEKEQLTGLAFIQWLHGALADEKIILNKTPLFMVPGGMLMSVEAYKLFAKEHPEFSNWQAVQKGFLSLGLHATNKNGDMSRFEQKNNHKMHSGDVFVDYALALPETLKVHNITSGQTSNLSALELVFVAQFYSHFTQIQTALQTSPLPHLSASGIWQTVENTTEYALGNSNV